MTFRQFAFNNVVRNKRLYAAYFLSSLFTVMVFFTFAIFAFHPELAGEDMNDSVQQGMYIAGGIIYIFSFFFVLYSMSSFLQSRKNEFGLLMMQGMSIRQIRLMVFLENMIIGTLATLAGVLLGLAFAKGILLLAENVLIIDGKLDFYLPLKPVGITFISFMILFFVISLMVAYVLRSKKLIDLIKGSKVSKGEPKANLFLSVIAALLLVAGYTVALVVEGMTVLAVMLPVIIVVIIGTYLLFTQLSVYLIRKLKKNKHIFWHKTNMILFSDLSFRMKDNARTFFMVAIISTVAFSAIGTLFGFQAFLTDGLKIAHPNTFAYHAYDEDKEAKVLELTNQVLKEEGIEANKEETMLRYFPIGEDYVLIAKESEFNQFAKLIGDETIEIDPGQMRVVEFEGTNYGQTDELLAQSVNLTTGTELKAKEDQIIYSRALPATDSYYVVSDEDYDVLPITTDEIRFHAWQATAGEENVLAAADRLYEELGPYEITSGEYDVYQVNKSFGLILFVGLFIGVVFFVSAGSFLYFRLYADLDEDKQKFKAITKMGLTEKELEKVLSRQTAILFFIPIIIALVHGAVALTALSHMFFYDLFRQSVMVLGTFLVIQVIYFFIVRYLYIKQIKQAVL